MLRHFGITTFRYRGIGVPRLYNVGKARRPNALPL